MPTAVVTRAVEQDTTTPGAAASRRNTTAAASPELALPARRIAVMAVVPAVDETDTALPPAAAVSRRNVTPAVDPQVAGVATRTAVRDTTPLTPETDTGRVSRPTGTYATPPAVDRELALPVDNTSSDLARAYAEVVDSDDRHITFTLSADWNRNSQTSDDLDDLTDIVDELTITRELSPELPPEVGLVEGHAAASMEVTVAGSWGANELDPVEVLAPYRRDSPLFGEPIIGTPMSVLLGARTPIGVFTDYAFSGTLSRYHPSSSARNVQIEALDNVNQLRAPMSLDAYGLDSLLLRRYGSFGYFSRINSQWLIDRILRANHIYCSPPFRDDALVAATMHGSTCPERGGGGIPQEWSKTGVTTTQAWTRDGHPFNMLYPNPALPPMTGQWNYPAPLPSWSGRGLGMALWVRAPNNSNVGWNPIVSFKNSRPPNTVAIEMGFANGVPQVRCTVVGTTRFLAPSSWPIPAQPTFMYFGVHVAYSDTAWTVTAKMGASVYSISFPFTIPTIVDWTDRPVVDYRTSPVFSNFQLWSTKLPPAPTEWPGVSWTPQASVDPGANEFFGIPTITGEDSWELLKEVVAAEFGGCGFTKTGQFWFRSRAVTRALTNFREQITADRNLADLAVVVDEAGVRNTVTGVSSAQVIGDWEDIYVSTDPEEFVFSYGVTFFTVAIPEDVVLVAGSFSTTEAFYEDFQTLADQYQYRDKVRFAISDDAFGAAINDIYAVNMTWVLVRPGVLQFRITNIRNQTFRFALADKPGTDGTVTPGAPAFKVAGRRLITLDPQQTTVADAGSVARYGARSYDLGGTNRWRQWPGAVAGIASSVLAAVGQPVPVLDDITVPHDPRRDIYKEVVVSDPRGLGSTVATITKIASTFTRDGGATDTLTLRPIVAPGLGLLDDPDLGKVGSTLVFGT